MGKCRACEAGVIMAVDESNLSEAARIHSISWQQSHRAFCTTEWIDMHSPQRQEAYIRRKIAQGGRFYMLVMEEPVGIVSIAGNVMEDLYVLPDQQNKGFGTMLLRYAMAKCAGIPALWILENNLGAKRLYRRMGFMETGRRQPITEGLDEIELARA